MIAAALGVGSTTSARAKPLLAVTASFQAGVLSIVGDALDNSITISRNAAGAILVNGGAVAVAGGTPTVANVSQIRVFGQGGNDTLSLNEASGALPSAHLFGGTGNDALTGGSGGDQLFGQAGNDMLFGKGGLDFLFGGNDNDTLTGGDVDDQVFGESGNDRMVWNPGDDTDLNEGGAGTDTVEVNGGNGVETFTATANGTRVRFDRLDPAPFALDIGTGEQLVLNANGGDDKISATGNLAALIQITVDGGAGNDTLLGSNGADLLLGGDGGDFVDGQQGNDVAFLGAGDDTFQWDPGDGSDTIEGQADADTLRFNGSAAPESIDVSANGERLRVFRTIGTVTLDMDGTERVSVSALGGADTITTNSLAGTAVTQLELNLEGVAGSNAGDGQPDTLIVNGTAAADILTITGSAPAATVNGLSTRVDIRASEGTLDGLTINSLDGNDQVNAPALPANVIKLTADGGLGNDILVGSQGNDMLLGGDGNDSVAGKQGNDQVLLGAGDDTFSQHVSDGSDVVEGHLGQDFLRFTGSGGPEHITLAANGERLRFVHDLGGVAIDLNDTERIVIGTLGGANSIIVNDLAGTDVAQVALRLEHAPGTGRGDGESDRVAVNGTAATDMVTITGSGSNLAVSGLAAGIDLTAIDSGRDALRVNGQAGDDALDAKALGIGALLTLDGGVGNDVLAGGSGGDTLLGQDGDDVLIGGPGTDVIDGGAGDNFVVQD